jgi:hypothetical protein
VRGAIDDINRCHVVFIPKGDSARVKATIAGITSGSVLVVGEQPDFIRLGGAVSFVVDAGKVRFEINPSARTIKDLTVSSKLLRIARVTSSTPEGR